MIAILLAIVGAVVDRPEMAHVGRLCACPFSAIANDSIQTLGTFLASNSQKTWVWQWLFMGGIFVATTVYGWSQYQGDVSYERLLSKGFDKAPTEFAAARGTSRLAGTHAVQDAGLDHFPFVELFRHI